ncbi:Rap GTPase-activating protein [Entamoeba marina]
MSLPSTEQTTVTDNNSDVSGTKKKVIDEDTYNLMVFENEEKIYNLNAKINEYEKNVAQGMNLLKEYEALANYFPTRGERFCCGKIEKSSAVGENYSVDFSSQFPTAPKVMVCVLYPKVIKIDTSNLVVTPSNFSFKVGSGVPALSDGSFYFWMAYCPMKPRSEKMVQIVDKLKGVRPITEKEAESQISKYIKKFSVDDEDAAGRTFLYYACEKTYRGLTEFLINKGANVNCYDENRYSPLHKALASDKIDKEIVKMLINKKANRGLKNERMNTPLHYLCRIKNLADYLDILELLLGPTNPENNSKFVNEANSSGETALSNVCANSMCVQAIKLLCENGADVNHQTQSGLFPLYSAVTKGNTTVMEMLLNYGANIDHKYKGKALTKFAEENGQMEELMKIIKDKYDLSVMSEEEIKKIAENFENVPYPIESWTENVMSSKPLHINMETLPQGVNVENYYTCTTHKAEHLLKKNVHDPQSCIFYYQTYFKENDHNNYIINTDKEIAVISISDEKSCKRVISRTKRSDIRKIYKDKNDHQILKDLFPDFKDKNIAPIRGGPIFNSLIKFENFFTYRRYKFGCLYGAVGQTTEMEFFNNREGSQYFEHFLTLLGDKVELFGFQGFAGGLDTKNRLMGEFTIANKFSQDNIEVVFHVAPYLPFMETNDQQLDKKRHIGNDVVVLIFKEYNGTPEPIDITSFKTQFNHAFVVVGFDVSQQNAPEDYVYSVNICCKNNVAPAAPFITTDEYKHGELFSKFLISKLINAERMSQDATTFRSKRLTIRQNQLESLMNNFAKRGN